MAGHVTIALITDFPVVDRIIGHLNLTFVAERPRKGDYYQYSVPERIQTSVL